jgi:putative endopeptidase
MKMRQATFAAAIAFVASTGFTATPFYPPFGLDLNAPDKSTRPGDDFFQYSNGTYLANLQIPADQVSAGKRFDISKRTEANLHALLEQAAQNVGENPGDVQGKVGAMYAAFMNEAAIEAAGAKPISAELDAIRAASGEGRLSRPSAGLFECRDPPRRHRRRRARGRSGRMGVPARPQRRASRSFRLADDPADQRCL